MRDVTSWSGVALAIAAGILCNLLNATPATAAVRSVCDSSALQNAASVAAAGDVIQLCSKTWQDVRLSTSAKGTAGSPIVITAAEPGKAVLTGSTLIELGGEYLVIDGLVFTGTYTGSAPYVIHLKSGTSYCKFCRVTNTVFDSYNPADLTLEVQWIMVEGANHRIDHNIFLNKRDRGRMVTLQRDDNSRNSLRVDHNLFGKRPLNSGPALAIGTSGKNADSDSGSVVEFNLFDDVDGSGEIIVNKSSGNVYRGNVIRGSYGALSLRQGHRALVQGNYFFGDGEADSGGVRVHGNDHVIVSNQFVDINPGRKSIRSPIVLQTGDSMMDPTKPGGGAGWYDHMAAKNTVVGWNTFLRTGNAIAVGVGDVQVSVGVGDVFPSGIQVGNNLFQSVSGGIFKLLVPLATDTWSKGNLYENTTVGASIPGFAAASLGIQTDAARVARLTSGSPAVDESADVPGIAAPTDIDGSAATGSARDAGADELTSFRADPVSACDVGPTTYGYGPTTGCASDDPAPAPPDAVIVE